MDIFNEGKSLLKDAFYSDVRHYKNFYYLQSVFTHKWYNLIVPAVPPANMDWYSAYKIIDEETRRNAEVSLYIRHDLYSAYKPFLSPKGYAESEDDVYVRYLVQHPQPPAQGDIREVDSTTQNLFLEMGNTCFPDWNNEEYCQLCVKLSTDFKNNDDKKNINVLIYDRGEAVAVGCFLYSTKQKLGYIHNTGTVPEKRRNGYFSKLLQHFLHIAAQSGIEVVYANVENHGPSFHGFLKMGFLENCRYHLFSR